MKKLTLFFIAALTALTVSGQFRDLAKSGAYANMDTLTNRVNDAFNYLDNKDANWDSAYNKSIYLDKFFDNTTDTGGGTRIGSHSVDFQRYRNATDQVASGNYSGILYGGRNKVTSNYSGTGGYGNRIGTLYGGAWGATNYVEDNPTIGTEATGSFAFGVANTIWDYYGYASGTGNLVDCKIGSAQGNTNISSGDDGFVAGNLGYNGRLKFAVAATGVEDAGGGLGSRFYVTISKAIYGDVIGFFPYKGVNADSIAPRWGSGATVDTNGFVYVNPYVFYTDKDWAMKPYAILKNNSEGASSYSWTKIVYAVDNGTHIKVYFEPASAPISGITYVFGSYNHTVPVRWFSVAGTSYTGGTGSIAMGFYPGASGYGAVSIGNKTEAWWNGSVALATESHTNYPGDVAMSSGMISTPGDAQQVFYTKKTNTTFASDVFNSILYQKIAYDTNSILVFEVTSIVKDCSVDSSTYGESASYKTTMMVNASGAWELVGTPTCTLIARNFTDGGNGTSTGVRIALPSTPANTVSGNYVYLWFYNTRAGHRYHIVHAVKMTQLK